jgi:hypothetical protein
MTYPYFGYTSVSPREGMRMLESPEISLTFAQDRHDEDPGPCPGCEHFARCGRKLIACQAFAAFTRRDPRWETRSRSPLAETYRAIFKSADLPQLGGGAPRRGRRSAEPLQGVRS